MIKDIVNKQRIYFNEGSTLSYESRIKIINKLKKVILSYEEEILKALSNDLNKSPYEAYLSELSLVLNEINLVKKNLRKWMKPKRVKSSLSTIFSKSYLYKEPYGVVLVISPWNYPLQLSLIPLISAVSAGNTVILKPSSSSSHVSEILTRMINDNFDESVLYVSNEKSDVVMKERYDYIFFTGSPRIGKKVMEQASLNLTPVTLELGGKSPLIVDESAKIELAAKRIVLGKMMNSGQTCIAPDYMFVHYSLKDKLINEIIKCYELFYPHKIKDTSYPKIINERHFNRLISLFKNEKIIYGGNYDEKLLKIELTLLDSPSLTSEVMSDEIFGPILPIYEFSVLKEVIKFIKSSEKPLALYMFSYDKNNITYVINNISFGSGAINDTIMQISNHHLPFGGVGNSGMGRYHGWYGFDTFTHEKPILKSSSYFDLTLKYPPYSDEKMKLLKRLFK